MISADDVKEPKKQYEKGLSGHLLLFLYLLWAAMAGPIIVKLDETKLAIPDFLGFTSPHYSSRSST